VCACVFMSIVYISVFVCISAMQFRDHVEFDLMHEFTEGYFFDFHVDTKPNDGTFRTGLFVCVYLCVSMSVPVRDSVSVGVDGTVAVALVFLHARARKHAYIDIHRHTHRHTHRETH